ncbi:MAG: hypothetical protein HY696_00480 [Deltaproteobacteria bacterium]|nr:hypothetical protein [Deltaproteobacteria bacterium]
MRTILACLVLGLLSACGSTTATTSGTTTTDSGSTGLRLVASGDFSSSASAALAAPLQKTTTGTCSSLTAPITMDDPVLADGLDCDGDSGIVAHITPSTYAIAFKKITLNAASGGTSIDLLADTGTLANSEVVDFTAADSTESVITIAPSSLTAGTYSGITAELYYFQLTFPVGGTTRHVRIYMSDDDFTAEGSLGHHQGDITFIDDNGTELGWVDDTWSDSLSSSRGEAQNGAGGTDSQTSHDRGYFGNAELWNQTALQQGSTQDIFVTTLDFASPLIIPDPSTISNLTTVTVTFSIADTFYYEDFAPQGTGFAPASGGEASAETREWAPLAPEGSVSVSSS